jgi:phosphatidylglycerophosphate synthase
MSASPPQTQQPAAVGWILTRDAGVAQPPLRIFGLEPEERLRRAFERAGCAAQRVRSDAPPPLQPSQRVAMLRDDFVLDERIVAALVASPDTMLVDPRLGPLGANACGADVPGALLALAAGAQPPTRLRCAAPASLVPTYLASLRKSEPAWLFPAQPERVAEIEAHVFGASYKGLTDLVTKWVWPRPARAATRWCAEHRVTPNAVTLLSWVLAIATTGLFATGWFGVGLVAAWAMTFLDTVDGKLARVTLRSSRIGDVLDHGLDLLHPPFWYLAWGLGLEPVPIAATAVCVVGYVAGRLLEGAFLARFRIETHSWRPIDALFRTITARRNPNLILLSVGCAGARPDLGLVMVALWTAVSLAFHAMRLAQAFAARRRGEAVVAWDSVR